MPTNDFVPFAGDVGANVIDQADYVALAARLTGFQAGTALSVQLNKAWRQPALVSAMIGEFVNDQAAVDFIDDGTAGIPDMLAGFIAAIQATAVAAGVAYGVDSGTTNAIDVTPSPSVGSLTQGLPILVKVAATNTAPVTIDVNSLGAVGLVNVDGSPLAAGQISANGVILVCYVGTSFQLISMPPPSFFGGGGGSGSANDFFGVTTGSANAYSVTTVPAFVTPLDGYRIWVRINATNTTDSTINVNASGAAQILGGSGIALEGNEMVATGVYGLVWVASIGKWRLFSSSLGSVAGQDPAHDQQFATAGWTNDAIAAAIDAEKTAAAAISNVRSVLREWPLTPPIAGTYRFVLRARVSGTVDSLSWNCGTASTSFTANIRINGVSVTSLSAVNVNNTTTQTTLANSGTPVQFPANAVIDAVITGVIGSPVGAALQLNYTVDGH